MLVVVVECGLASKSNDLSTFTSRSVGQQVIGTRPGRHLVQSRNPIHPYSRRSFAQLPQRAWTDDDPAAYILRIFPISGKISGVLFVGHRFF
jgi:hypothetical protein